jgi:hypothetical protein
MFSFFSHKNQHDDERSTRRYRELIRREAQIGGELFGPIPTGVRREFFCLDRKTWVWHEEWTDKSGKRRVVTTRYDVRPNGVLKAQDGQPYRYVELEEGKRLYKAARMYNYRVQTELYGAEK